MAEIINIKDRIKKKKAMEIQRSGSTKHTCKEELRKRLYENETGGEEFLIYDFELQFKEDE